MTTITTEKIEELRGKAKKATPGARKTKVNGIVTIGAKNLCQTTAAGSGNNIVEQQSARVANAEFIAACDQETILALLDLAQRAMVPQPQGQFSLSAAANLALNALHECVPNKGAERQISDAIRFLDSALRDIAYTQNRTATPAQFAKHLQKTAQDALTASQLALPAGPVPEGYKLVPVRPTRDMLIAAGFERGNGEEQWEAMLAAVPQPTFPSTAVAQPVADELKRAIEKLAHAATDAVRVLHWYHDNSGAPILDTLPGTIRRLKKALDSDAARAALRQPAEEGGKK